MRSSSCALAGEIALRPNATQPPIMMGPMLRSSLFVMTVPPCVMPPPSGRHRYELLVFFLSCRFLRQFPPLANALRDAHQAAREIEDSEHINAAKHILPPGHHRTEVFAQSEHDEGADDAAHQRSGAAQHGHEQRI